MRPISCLFCLLVWASGCASNQLTPYNLPQNLQAQAASNAKRFDLSRLATSTEPDDVIARGDVLDVMISAGLADDEPLKMPARVNDRGEIDIAYLGRIPVNGLRMAEAEAEIARSCRELQLYRDPTVNVEMKQSHVHRIQVVGAVEKPDTYELRAGKSDLLSALTKAGGLSKNADTVIEIRHPGYRNPSQRPQAIAQASGIAGDYSTSYPTTSPTGERALRVDLAALASNQSQQSTLGYELEDGAVVMVNQVDYDPVRVIGLVRTPKPVEIATGKNLHFLGAVSEAGGISNKLADKAYVIRRRPGQPPAYIHLSIADAKKDGRQDLLLEPGDVVSVEQTPATWFLDIVQLVGLNVNKSLP